MGYRYVPEVKKPSEHLEDLMMGRIAWEDADHPIRSLAQKHLYDAACIILSKPTVSERRRILSRIPERIRPYVEAEVLRLHKMRKE